VNEWLPHPEGQPKDGCAGCELPRSGCSRASMMTRAAPIQEQARRRHIGAGLGRRTSPGVLQSSPALLRSQANGGAGV